MILLKLFFTFARIGILSFGGAYAALPIVRDVVVYELSMMTEAEFADIMVISEMTPGPITINAATFVGTNEAGILGAIAATLGFIFPSAVIITLLSLFLKKYGSLKPVGSVLSVMRPCVIGLIAAAGASMAADALGEGVLMFRHFDIFAALMIASGIAVMRRFRLSPIAVMAASGVIGIIVYGLPSL